MRATSITLLSIHELTGGFTMSSMPYSSPQVSHVGDAREVTQGSGNYLSDSSTGYGYMGWYARHLDTPDTVAALPPRD